MKTFLAIHLVDEEQSVLLLALWSSQQMGGTRTSVARQTYRVRLTLPRVHCMPTFTRDNISFHYLERGNGAPFFFQHGLGGDAEAVCALVEPPPGFCLLAMDFRGHGKTTPLGDVKKIGFDPFADDLLSLMDHLSIAKAIIGGTSMGAGVALNFAIRFPDRVLGLVLQRPAWLDQPNPENVAIFGLIAELLKKHGPADGLQRFKQTSLYAAVAAISSDSANSLLAQFIHPRALETVAKLECIPQDAPNRDRTQWRSLTIPALILANRSDPIHPFEYGKALAQEIPGAQFRELTPKSINLGQYTQEVRSFISDFLMSNWSSESVPS